MPQGTWLVQDCLCIQALCSTHPSSCVSPAPALACHRVPQKLLPALGCGCRHRKVFSPAESQYSKVGPVKALTACGNLYIMFTLGLNTVSLTHVRQPCCKSGLGSTVCLHWGSWASHMCAPALAALWRAEHGADPGFSCWLPLFASHKACPRTGRGGGQAGKT